ncbi:hypothetical protein AB4Z09_28585 [Rhodococcus sp. TAF43]
MSYGGDWVAAQRVLELSQLAATGTDRAEHRCDRPATPVWRRDLRR